MNVIDVLNNELHTLDTDITNQLELYRVFNDESDLLQVQHLLTIKTYLIERINTLEGAAHKSAA